MNIDILIFILVVTCPIWASIFIALWILGAGAVMWIFGVPVKITINGIPKHYRWFKRIS